jgi:hypothetical protein
LFFAATRHFVPGYLHIVPSGQILSTPVRKGDANPQQINALDITRMGLIGPSAPLVDEDEDE